MVVPSLVRARSVERWGEWLVCLSCFYLGLPALLFFGGWLRAPWNVGGVLLLGVVFWRIWPRPAPASDPLSEEDIHPKVFWWTLLPCLLALVFSGIGALVAQHHDWNKHNAVLQDLVERTWPVTYQIGVPDSGSFYLLYYQGYYLPAAFIGRLLGTGAIPWALLLWSGMGMSLLGGWIVFFTRGRAPWAGFLFFAFDGLKFLGLVLGRQLTVLGVLHEGPLHSLTATSSWWAGRPHFQFSSFFSLIAVVPQHALSGWLGAALLGYAMFHPRARQTSTILCCVFPFCLLWSVFVGLATFLMTLVAVFVRWKNKLAESTPAWNAAGLLGITLYLAGILGLYYAGRGSSALAQTIPTFPLLAWAKQPALVFDFLLRIALWTAVEWAILFWLASRLRPKLEARERVVLAAPLFLLLGLPFLHVGAFNDLLMRGIIPAQFFLFLWIANALCNARLDGTRAEVPVVQPVWAKALLIALLVLGPLNNLYLFRPQALATARHLSALRAPSAPEERDLNALVRWQKANASEDGSLEGSFDRASNVLMWQVYRTQYLGRTSSVWWRFFAKK